MSRILKFLCAAGFLLATARAEPLPDAPVLLKRVQARMEQIAAESGTNHFQYMRTNVIEELDSDGKLKKRSEKTYEVALVRGLPRARLIAIDGRTLPEGEQRWRNSEEQKLQRTFTPEKSSEAQKPKAWLTDDLLERFNFVVAARTNDHGRNVYIMTFRPRPGAATRSMVDRIVNNLAGQLWIDAEEAEIARIDLGMSQPVKFWGGFLGQLDRFNWTLQRTRSDSGVWFNQLSTGLFQIRKLLATSRFRVSEESFNFHPSS